LFFRRTPSRSSNVAGRGKLALYTSNSKGFLQPTFALSELLEAFDVRDKLTWSSCSAANHRYQHSVVVEIAILDPQF
ncbi:MAG: hypothetical protein ACK411_15515, partial [Exiguobacterium mexicanum]